MLDKTDANFSIRRQTRLLKIHRSKIYYQAVMRDESDLANRVLESYTQSDCRYGYRKVHHDLIEKNLDVSQKKVLKVMKKLGFQGIYPKKKCQTTIANKAHKIYPYLLDKIDVVKVNQVWTTDITYIQLQDKFMYFIAIIDIYSRYIVGYGLSHSLECEFYVFVLSGALSKAKPEIFNTDQGSQFTSNNFIALLMENGIQISMDHTGRCFDNIHIERLWRTIKQEAVYYYKPETIAELENVLNEFVTWYNNDRKHQSLGYKKPAQIYYGLN